MSAASVKVIDLQAYRSARLAQQPTQSGTMAATVMPLMAPIAWLPVWFMPIYFVGVSSPAE
jgi:hypothetical protein